MRRMVGILLALFAAPLLFAAEHHETTTVEVVQVPVHVMRDNSSVTGLTRADFELFVNGKPQAIEYFDVVDYATLSTEEARDPRQRRLYVLVFDFLFSEPFALLRAQKAALQFVARARETDLFCIASYRGTRGLEIVVPFTKDRVAVQGALMRLQGTKNADPLHLALSEPERVATLGYSPFNDGGSVWRDVSSLAMHEMMLEPVTHMMSLQVDALSGLAERLAPIEGVKHVVLLSGGHDNSMLTGIRRFGIGRTSEIGRGSGVLTTPVMGDAYGGHRILEMGKAFARAGVFLDTLDINGIPGPWTPPQNDSLYTLAHETGGTVMSNRNDLLKAMTTLADRQRVAYVLGFNAHDTGRDTNSIRVVVHDQHGAEVSYRPSYSTTPVKLVANDGLRVADILLNDIPQNGVSVKATVRSEGNRQFVDVELPPRSEIYVGGGTEIRGEALFYIYRGDAVVAFQQTSFGLEGLPRNRVLQPVPIGLSEGFDLKPGHYVAKVLIRFEGYEEMGFARTDFDVK